MQVAEVDLSPLGLKEDLALGGEWIGTHIREMAVHVLVNDVAFFDEFEQIPLAIGFFEFTAGVAEAYDILFRALVDVADVDRGAWRAGDAFAIGTGDSSAVSEPKVAGFSLLDLELDRTRPNLGFARHTIKNAAIPSLSRAFAEGACTPFELGTQVEAIVRLPGDDVPHLLAGDMENAVSDGEDVFGIVVETAATDKGVKPVQRGTLKEVDGRCMSGNGRGGGALRKESRKRS